MTIVAVLIMLMMKSQECTSPHKQVEFFRLKQVIYNRFVQLRKFDESDLELERTNKPHRKT